MGLREVGSSLPPGFRFHPSDEELVCHYLYMKAANKKTSQGTTMVEVDLHIREPWDLPEMAKLSSNEWYFFSFRDRKYATGSRTNRATKSGYWKATGKDRTIYNSKKHVIGMRKTLVFYLGRAPNGIKSNWVMHEFRLESPHSQPKEDWVLCRVFHKRKDEREKETTTCYTAISPPALWNSSSPVVIDQSLPCYEEINGCSLSTITTYQEDDNNLNYIHNASLMQCDFLHDFTYDQMEMGPKDGNIEQYELMWDMGLVDHSNDIVNMEEAGFPG